MSKWEDKYSKLKNGECDRRIDELKDKLAKKTITREEYKEYEKLLRAKSNLGKVENVLGYKGKLEKDLEDLNRELTFRKNSASASIKIEELNTGLNVINIQISNVEKELKNPEIKEERKKELLAKRKELYESRDANASEFAKQQNVLEKELGRKSKLKDLSEKELENNMTLLKTKISKCNMVAKNLLNGASWDTINLKLDNWDKNKKFTKKKDEKNNENAKIENGNSEKGENNLKQKNIFANIFQKDKSEKFDERDIISDSNAETYNKNKQLMFEKEHPRLAKIQEWLKKCLGKKKKCYQNQKLKILKSKIKKEMKMNLLENI